MPGKPDYYWQKSKDQGYPARSVWKLQEMQERFRLLDAGPRVLDLGCSPGSWSLMVLELLAGGEPAARFTAASRQFMAERR